MIVNGFELEEYNGSDVIRHGPPKYWRCSDFKDKPANLTQRMRVFYNNLMILALAHQTNRVPVCFRDDDGADLYLDRGCIKIAEYAGFIRPIQNGSDGLVKEVELSFLIADSQ